MRWALVRASLPLSALVLFAVPSRWEGPVLVPVSPGHGLSVVDLAATVPLLGTVVVIGVALVTGRALLARQVRDAPRAAAGVLLTGGLGLGLLLASVFPFFWWWAVGAVLLTAALSLATLTALGRVGGGLASRP